MKTQNEALLTYLNNNPYITTWVAYDKFGVTSLPKRICELQKTGVKIEKAWIKGKNRYGNVVSVRKYWVE